jgi:hypothetical protein
MLFALCRNVNNVYKKITIGERTMYKQITDQEQKIILEKKIAKFLQEVAALPPEQRPTEVEIATAIHNISHETLVRIYEYNKYVRDREPFGIPDARIERHPSEFDKKNAAMFWRSLAKSSDKKIADVAFIALTRS